MRVGTRSILFGYHAFWLHPWFVAWGWTKLYGFPWDPRLWVAFFVHDLGYWGKPNMDGEEGEQHVRFGAELMHKLFDLKPRGYRAGSVHWQMFCALHSRFWAKREGCAPSKLCFADKLAYTLCPVWLAVLLYSLTGEVEGSMRDKHGYGTKSLAECTREGQEYCRKWVEEFKDGRRDSWTTVRNAI